MTNSELHRYDHSLCGHVRHNLAALFVHGRSEELKSELDPRLVAHLDPAREEDNTDNLLLSWTELFEVELAVRLLAPRREWTAHPVMHRRHVLTIAEVQQSLTRATAEEWAETCRKHARSLERRGLLLFQGIAVVREWVTELRRLLKAAGRRDLLPAPEGTCPTPTVEIVPSTPVCGADERDSKVVGAAPEPARQLLPVQGVEEELSLQQAAEVLGVDKKTALKLVEEGVLEWRNAAPPSSTRPVYRIRAASLVHLRNAYSRGGVAPAAPTASSSQRRRHASPAYEPRHIRRPKSG